ncbi:hypothetical protein GCM10027615_51460 [Plantactinospora veratri]
MPARADREQGDPGRAGEYPGELGTARSFAEEGGGQHHRDQRLGLQHQRGEPGRHPGVDGDEEGAELEHAEDQPVTEYVAQPRGRAGNQEDQRQCGGDEPQRGQHQRRQVAQAHLDDDEVDPQRAATRTACMRCGNLMPTTLPASMLKVQFKILNRRCSVATWIWTSGACGYCTRWHCAAG